MVARDGDSGVLEQVATGNGRRGAAVAAGSPASVEPPPRASAEVGTPPHDKTAADAVAAEEKPAAQRELGDSTLESEARRRISGGAKLDALQGVS